MNFRIVAIFQIQHTGLKMWPLNGVLAALMIFFNLRKSWIIYPYIIYYLKTIFLMRTKLSIKIIVTCGIISMIFHCVGIVFLAMTVRQGGWAWLYPCTSHSVLRIYIPIPRLVVLVLLRQLYMYVCAYVYVFTHSSLANLAISFTPLQPSLSDCLWCWLSIDSFNFAGH